MLSKYGKLPQRKDLLSQKLNVSIPLSTSAPWPRLAVEHHRSYRKQSD